MIKFWPWLAVKDVVNSELDEGADADEQAAETGHGESLVLAELGRRAALAAACVLRAL